MLHGACPEGRRVQHDNVTKNSKHLWDSEELGLEPELAITRKESYYVMEIEIIEGVGITVGEIA
jgi:hypothetical protein